MSTFKNNPADFYWSFVLKRKALLDERPKPHVTKICGFSGKNHGFQVKNAVSSKNCSFQKTTVFDWKPCLLKTAPFWILRLAETAPFENRRFLCATKDHLPGKVTPIFYKNTIIHFPQFTQVNLFLIRNILFPCITFASNKEGRSFLLVYICSLFYFRYFSL